MIIGIVGAEGAKFTPSGKYKAQVIIRDLVLDPNVTEVCSGECHLGGVDRWARLITEKYGKKFTPFPPSTLSWEGYKARNLQIAGYSDVVYNIVVNQLPPDFKGMTHKLCYHCGTSDHVKSGGCWTMKKAKKGVLYVVQN